MQSIDEERTSIKIINPMKEKKKEWEEFVYNHPNGNIFQTPYLTDVFERTKGIEPIALASIDEDSGEILASLLAFVIKYTNIFGSFTSRARIKGGPLFLDNEEVFLDAKMLLKHYDRVVRKKALYTDIGNLWDIHNLSASIPIRDSGYVYEDHLNFLIDLTKPKEELWAGLSKSRRRYIRKAREKGVTVEEIKNRKLIPIFYDLLCQIYKNAKIPLVDISLFYAAYDILAPKNMIKLFLVRYKDEYIGGIMTPIYKGAITEWYVCGSRAHSKLYPSEMATWHPIEWGSENGYHTFDFGGAGNPNEEYGVREFKRQFGGQLVNYGRYKKIHSPIKMSIAEKGFKIYKKIKSYA